MVIHIFKNENVNMCLRIHVNMINVETIYWTCGVFNSLNIKLFILLNVSIFLFLDTLICALKTQINIKLHIKKTNE
jgi:hypothetical protein